MQRLVVSWPYAGTKKSFLVSLLAFGLCLLENKATSCHVRITQHFRSIQRSANGEDFNLGKVCIDFRVGIGTRVYGFFFMFIVARQTLCSVIDLESAAHPLMSR